MQTWAVQDAKARFSEFLDTCLADGPQMVTRRGADAAILVPIADWLRLQAQVPPSLKALLLEDGSRFDATLPARGKLNRRSPEVFG